MLRSIWSWSFPTSRYRTNVAIPVVIVTVIEVFELHTYELVRALRTPFLAAHLLESTEISSYIAQRYTAFSGLLSYNDFALPILSTYTSMKNVIFLLI